MTTLKRHEPNRLASYVEIHETVMEHLRRGGFVVSDDLRFEFLNDWVVLEGTIICQGGIYIDVFKRLAILDGAGANAIVQTVEYSYNAVISGKGNIFRYNSPHPTHNEFHHVHRFDVLNGDKRGTVERAIWPLLSEVIEEAMRFYHDHYQQLGA